MEDGKGDGGAVRDEEEVEGGGEGGRGGVGGAAKVGEAVVELWIGG